MLYIAQKKKKRKEKKILQNNTVNGEEILHKCST